MFLHDYLLVCEISMVSTQTLKHVQLSNNEMTHCIPDEIHIIISR